MTSCLELPRQAGDIGVMMEIAFNSQTSGVQLGSNTGSHIAGQQYVELVWEQE
jgi:hypothetical protein